MSNIRFTIGQANVDGVNPSRIHLDVAVDGVSNPQGTVDAYNAVQSGFSAGESWLDLVALILTMYAHLRSAQRGA